MKDKQIDHLLNISTIQPIRSFVDSHHNAYEPTDYEVLDTLIETKLISKENTLIDYGCGKGRVDFYLHHQLGCHTIGIEFNESIIQYAYENLERSKMDHVEFILQDASLYKVPLNADRFYFFNPFSLPILRKVIQHILDSYVKNPREMYLFFYYPTDEYLHYLLMDDDLSFVDEISTNEIYHTNSKYEAIFIFEVTSYI